MTAPPIPTKILDITRALLENGWTFRVSHGADGVGHRFISIDAQLTRETETLRMTWHTRASEGKTYRWWGALLGQRQLPSYTKALAIIRQESQ